MDDEGVTEEEEAQYHLNISHCSLKIQKRITTKLKKGPSKTDGEGHIYVYKFDDKDLYYKIGRTSRSVDKRLKEWKGAILQVSWKVRYQKLAESIIHAYLDHVRVYRYDLGKGELCTIWKSNGEPVTEHDKQLKAKYKLEARKKHIEWFKMPWKVLEQKVIDVIKLNVF